MVFASQIFLFLFLPVFLTVYYLFPTRWRNGWILIGSYAFYGWWRVDFLGLFFLTTVWTYALGRVIHANRDRVPSRSRAALAVGVVGNLGVLAYFKYAGFGVEALDTLLQTLGARPLPALEVILPIGISFYVFQAVSYLIDVHRRDAPPARSFLDLAAFIALFPQLIAGPILRYKDVASQFTERSHSFGHFAEGAQRFMIGFAKKVLIADTVAPIADAAFALSAPTFADASLGVLAYSVQLFFDFSGYSDMAIGLGKMMGFDFMENFDAPYLSRSITEFWRRWHISLSTWLRDYLYIPLGGNRRGRTRTYANLLTVMVLGGLWHGAAWNFALWGAWHGAILAIERFAKERALAVPFPRSVSVAWTLMLVSLGWVTFRADGIQGALTMYQGLLAANGWAISDAMHWQISSTAAFALVAAWSLVFATPWLRSWRPITRTPTRYAAMGQIAIALVFTIGLMRLLATSYSPFLYFQF